MYTYSTLSLRTWRMHVLLHVGATEPYAHIQDKHYTRYSWSVQCTL